MLYLARMFVLILSIAYYLRKQVKLINNPFRTQRAGTGRVMRIANWLLRNASISHIIARRRNTPFEDWFKNLNHEAAMPVLIYAFVSTYFLYT